MRATFDSDASNLIGQFLPDSVGDEQADESQAGRTRCSEFIKPKKIAASGEVEDVFGASASVGGKVGVKGVVQIQGERKATNAVRIKYTALEKYVADVDTKGLYECCQNAPDQCPGRYISQTLAGDGRIFVATEKQNSVGVEAEGSFKHIPISADAFYKDGVKWERTTEFKGQHFAFSMSRVLAPSPIATNSCDWVNNIPRSLDGQYFVGVSEPMPSERVARDMAMREARAQVVKYIGEYLEQGSSSSQNIKGALGAAGGELEQNSTVDAIANGVAKLVKDERWCGPEKSETPKGTLQTMKVLAFFPNSERAAAARIQLQTLMDVLKQKGKLTPALEAQFQKSIADVK
ncbi:MAG: hypothetical protein JNJ54_32955 [Myxococcaceae bacterium]|nr:hypothetical protein [Myxococcaceae bacterium]